MKITRKIISKKAIFYTMDALLASMLLMGAVLLIYSTYSPDDIDINQQTFISQDILTVVSELKLYELNNSFVTQEVLNGNITDMNKTVLDQIGEYWALNEVDKAQMLLQTIVNESIPSNYGVRTSMGNNTLLLQNITNKINSVASNRMISGIEQGRPITGSSGASYLKKVRDKKTSSYAYFGGFVGQGNITVTLEEIPSDVGFGDVKQILMELDAVAPFQLFINNNWCANLTPTGTMMLPSSWDLTYCNASVQPGINNVTLLFYNNINNAYVMGGNIRVEYQTDELKQTMSFTSKTYSFPEIKGIVNLYDGFYAPGDVTGMNIYLHYLADHSVTALNNTFYLTIGNTIVYIDTNSTLEQSITLNDSTLRAMLNYSTLSGKTVPIRMGFENLSYESQLIGNSEVMIATDISGSMDYRMDSDSGGSNRNCDNININASDTTRLSVAKCSDKTFAQNVLNITGNKLGLISYSTSTSGGSTVSPTTNLTKLTNTIGNASPETGYVAGGNTCICCGINSARDQLTLGAVRTFLINKSMSWKYNTNNFKGDPANDSLNNSWYSYKFNDTTWSSGSAVLGHAYGGVTVTTELGVGNSSGGFSYANLWENAGDVPGAPNDFTSSILNSTGNTFGVGGAYDGWDWAGGVPAYGFDSVVNFSGAKGGHLNLSFGTGSPVKNKCTNFDCSGAYGISVNVTPQMYAYLQNNGSAFLSFFYQWDQTGNPFTAADQVWIKARFTRPDGTAYWLGKNMDTNQVGADNTPEIYTVDNPNMRFSGNAMIDLTKMINGSGMYYLDLGAKLNGSANTDFGSAYFDNLQIVFSNTTDHYFFRKHFNVTNMNNVKRGVLNLLTDDFAKVYLNGNLIFDGQEKLNGTYWDRRGLFVDQRNFELGDNVVAVELTNMFVNNSAQFDLELIGINKSEQGAMLVMTDGVANVACAEQGTVGDLDGDGTNNTASDVAIQAACDARQKWGLQVFSVGFSSGSDEPTLKGIADCGEGIYTKSNNVSALDDFYNQVVLNIVSATIQSQTVIVSGGNLSASNLYRDSYITFNYTSPINDTDLNEISVQMQTAQFNNCSADITIPAGVKIVDAVATSYSGPHWTRSLIINSDETYNLTDYNSQYISLGDPYLIYVPPGTLTGGVNHIYIDTGDDSQNSTGCSPNNTLIYTALIPSTVSRSEVMPNKVGCKWIVESENGGLQTVLVPSTYAGSKTCYYTSSNMTYNDASQFDDAYDLAVYTIFRQLDVDGNGKIIVSLASEDLEVIVLTVGGLPYMWGPSLMKLEVWQ